MLKMVFEPIMASRMEDLQFAELFQQSLVLSEQMGDISAPEELNLLGKQFLYFERYVKGIAPGLPDGARPVPDQEHLPRGGRTPDGASARRGTPAMPVDPDEDLPKKS